MTGDRVADPAVDAAERAWEKEGWGPGEPAFSEGHLAIAAAREALAPLRELHQRRDYNGIAGCTHCHVVTGWPHRWPCATARLIYREDEL